jgi:hypothetical protein
MLADLLRPRSPCLPAARIARSISASDIALMPPLCSIRISLGTNIAQTFKYEAGDSRRTRLNTSRPCCCQSSARSSRKRLLNALGAWPPVSRQGSTKKSPPPPGPHTKARRQRQNGGAGFQPSSFEMRCTVPVPIPSDLATFKIVLGWQMTASAPSAPPGGPESPTQTREWQGGRNRQRRAIPAAPAP